MKIEPLATLLFTGDSITDCGRERPVGENGGLGNGYAAQAAALLKAVYPQYGLRVLNTGVGGDTTAELKARWQSDCLDLQPDWLSVMIGTNDVWRQMSRPEEQQSLAGYERNLREMLSAVRGRLKGLVLMTPYLLEANREDRMRKLMDECGRIVRRLAEEFAAIFVDTQAAFDQMSGPVYLPSLSFNWDRVHPDAAGHAVLARAFLNGVEFSWNGK